MSINNVFSDCWINQDEFAVDVHSSVSLHWNSSGRIASSTLHLSYEVRFFYDQPIPGIVQGNQFNYAIALMKKDE